MRPRNNLVLATLIMVICVFFSTNLPGQVKRPDYLKGYDILQYAPQNDTLTSSILVKKNRFIMQKRAFFCRIEDLISSRSNVMVKMRLGSVEYVDKLEGKP